MSRERPYLSDTDLGWVRVPYQVTLGEEADFTQAGFKTMADALAWTMDVKEGHVKYTGGKGAVSPDANDLANFVNLPGHGIMGVPFFKDTRVGANDAINCLWQFNRDDDIVHPMHYSTTEGGIGLGRVYASTIEQNQTIAWFTFGTARFAKLSTFYAKAFDSDLIKLNSTGFLEGKNLGGLIASAFGLVISVPTLPLRWMYEFATKTLNFQVDRFYDLRCTMHFYYKYVDTILVTWLVNAGLYTSVSGDSSWTASTEMLPMALRETGASIWDILRRKCNMLGRRLGRGDVADMAAMEQEIAQISAMGAKAYDDEETSPTILKWKGDATNWNQEGHEIKGANWGSLIWESALGATQFVGFRVEKSTDASESFSNSTGPSEFGEKINSLIAEKRSQAFDMANGNTGISIVDSAIGLVNDVLTGVSSVLDMDNLATAVIGGAFIDIPEQYKGSDFNKSHSLSFQLRSPYGDIVSIYQSIIVPLAMILAGALPHAAGPNSYMQPFLCRCYVKGMFSVPLGIIDSLSIRRGSSEFGWTYQNLPTCMDITVGIKDLSPIMYIGLKDGLFDGLFSSTNTFDEYLLTLAGAGMWERVSRWEGIKRKMQITAHKIRNTVSNPMYHASWISENTLLQFVTSFFPSTRIPS